ncbi:hypothetical protein D6817_03450 [Candidatus Pacearchaeota archaeon]|nr:MAG: hypothetical protein D6817_03450 [Candidatus Pacearchaeota archaeon]
MFKGSTKVEKLSPGGSVAIETALDMSLGKNDKLAGNLVSRVGGLPEPRRKIKLRYTLFPKVFGLAEEMEVEPLKQGELLMLSINTSITGGNIEEVKEGEVVVNLRVPAVFFPNDTIGIARNIRGHWRLIGYGESIE